MPKRTAQKKNQSYLQVLFSRNPFFLKIFTPFPTSTYELYPPQAESNFRNIRATPSLIGWGLPSKASPQGVPKVVPPTVKGAIIPAL
jgi:hypothetical protein